MGAYEQELAKIRHADLGEVLTGADELNGVAYEIDSVAQSLRNIASDLGYTGAAGDSAADVMVVLSREFVAVADALLACGTAANTSYGAMVKAKDDYASLPGELGENETAARTTSMTAQGVCSADLPATVDSQQRQEEREALSRHALGVLDSEMAYAKQMVTDAVDLLGFGGSDPDEGLVVDWGISDSGGTPPGGDPGHWSPVPGTSSGAGTGSGVTPVGADGATSGATGSWSSLSGSVAASGAGGLTGAGGGGASGTGGVSGRSSADGSVSGVTAGATGSSGIGGGLSGVGGHTGLGGASGLFAAGATIGGTAAGAAGFGRFGIGGLGSGLTGSAGAGSSGGGGGLNGVGSNGLGSGGPGAGGGPGARGGAGGSGLGGRTGNIGIGSSASAGAAGGGVGGAGGSGTSMAGGMPMGGAGGGGSKGRQKRNSRGYLVPQFDIDEPQARPDLGPGARAGSREQLRAEAEAARAAGLLDEPEEDDDRW